VASAMAKRGAARPRATRPTRRRAPRRVAGAGILAAGVVHGLPSVGVLGAIAGPSAPPRLGPIRLRDGRGRPWVALTFDDGPSPTTTPRILSMLDKLGLRATFFVTGSEVAVHPELIDDIRSRGHAVETHGMLHRHHLLHSIGWVLADTRLAIEGLRSVGVTPRFIRPPYGQASAGTLVAARRHGLVPVLWSAWGREFADQSVDGVTTRVIRRLVPGSIVLLHDSDRLCGDGSVDAVEGALPRLAEELDRRQLQTVTVGELLG
jgi:peptidoglycan-N-acetylglucosamine deacetylase